MPVGVGLAKLPGGMSAGGRSRPDPMSEPLLQEATVYHVRPANVAGHLYEVTCRIEEPAPDGQLLSLPAWVPGSYLVRDYARHVVRLEAESAGGPVPVNKIDKHTWRVSPAPGPLICRALIYAADTSVRGSWLDGQMGFFNGVCLLFRVHGREHLPGVVHVDPPEAPAGAEWRVATSFRRLTGTRYEAGAFEARDYEDLIDHPVLMGCLRTLEFSVAGVPHVLAVVGGDILDEERIARDLAILCAWHQGLFGGPPPIDRYWFLLRAAAEGYGGLEHRFSSALLAGRDDLPRPGGGPMDENYRRFLGLASHEYFHLWLVKRIRPAEFAPADLTRETYTRQLWIFEGITSYYDDLALLRSGLIATESYLELLGQSLTRYHRTPGRRWQTLEEASFDAWIKFYRPDENSPNATVSYYLKGSLVALALDLELRLRSDGRCSLDEVMRALWEEYGRADSPGLPEGAFERLVDEVSGLQLEDFFRQCVRSTVDPPLGILLAQFGVRLNFRAAEGAADAGGRPGRAGDKARAWLGLSTRLADGMLRVSQVVAGGPAEAAGLAVGDELLALAGRRVRGNGLDAALDRLVPGQRVPVHLSRNDDVLTVTIEPVAAPRDTCFLTLDAEAGAPALARRVAWLGGRTPGTH